MLVLSVDPVVKKEIGQVFCDRLYDMISSQSIVSKRNKNNNKLIPPYNPTLVIRPPPELIRGRLFFL